MEASKSTAPLKFVRFVSTTDEKKVSACRIVKPLGTEQWTPGEKGVRIARSAIPEKDLPAENAPFRDVVSLYDSPNQSRKFPYECFNEEEALRDLDLEVDQAKGFATATLYYDVDEEALEDYRARQEELRKQQTRASRKRRHSNSCSTSSGTGRVTPVASNAATGTRAIPGDPADDAAVESGGDAAEKLGEDAKRIVQQGIAVVGPRQPNGRFKKRTDFKWATGWEAFLTACCQRIAAALPAYANWDADRLYSAVGDYAHQFMRNTSNPKCYKKPDIKLYSAAHHQSWVAKYGAACEADKIPEGDDWFVANLSTAEPAPVRALTDLTHQHPVSNGGNAAAAAGCTHISPGLTPAASAGLPAAPGVRNGNPHAATVAMQLLLPATRTSALA